MSVILKKVPPAEIAARASKLAALKNLTDREASIDATGKPDLIRDMYRGRMPSGERLRALAITLDTTFEYLLGDVDSPLRPDGEPAIIDMSRLPEDVPVFGTAVGADLEVEEDGTVYQVEQTILEMTDIRYYVVRQVGIMGDREAYSLDVVGSSMSPRYDDGDPIYVSPKRSVGLGDYVVAQVLTEDGSEVISALVKKLVGRGSAYYEFEQFTPHIRFRLPKHRVAKLHRILTPRELAGR